MKRTTLTASLVGSAAAGLMAAAIATPAWAQATTFPEGTDCSAIQNSASRTDCMSQMNESRQNQNSGTATQPGSPGTPPTGTTAPGGGAAGAAPATGAAPTGAAPAGAAPPAGAGGATGATGTGGTTTP
jgi:hypothetical protein